MNACGIKWIEGGKKEIKKEKNKRKERKKRRKNNPTSLDV